MTSRHKIVMHTNRIIITIYIYIFIYIAIEKKDITGFWFRSSLII